MKKFLFALPVIVLVAAGCSSSSSQPTTEQSPSVQQAQATQTQQQVTQNPTPTPSPQSSSSNPTYNGIDFSFQYPSNYQVDAQTQQIGYGGLNTIVSLTGQGTPVVVNPANSSSAAKIYISTDNKAFSVSRIPKDFTVNGPDTATKKTYGSNVWYDYSGGGGGVNYSDDFYFDLNGKLIQAEFWGPFTQISENHPDAAVAEQLILSSFKTSTKSNVQTYTRSGFTFQYPTSWQISSTGNPGQNPSSCGDAWGDAASCVNIDPSQLAKNMANTVTVFVFNTNVPLQSWCQNRNTGQYGTTFSNCQVTTINGNSAIITTSPSGDTPVIQYQIIASQGKLVMFQTANSNYQSDFNSIVNSIQFTK